MEFPLAFTFQRCIYFLDHGSLIDKTKLYRKFPYIEVDIPWLNFYHMCMIRTIMELFKKMGAGTSYLKITAKFPRGLLDCFPNVKQVEVDSLSHLIQEKLPPTLHTVIVKQASNTVRPEFWGIFQGVKVIKCKELYVKTFSRSNDELVELKHVSEDVLKLFDDERLNTDIIGTPVNLMSDQPINFEDITCLHLWHSPINFEMFAKFPNLEVSKKSRF